MLDTPFFLKIILIGKFCTNRQIAKSSFTPSKLRFRHLASHKISSIISNFRWVVGATHKNNLIISDFRGESKTLC